jgi:hypothetical protein
LKTCSVRARKLKLIDRTDNLLDLKQGPDDFKLVYARESMDLFHEALNGLYPALDEEFLEAIDSLMETTSLGRNWRIDEYK